MASSNREGDVTISKRTVRVHPDTPGRPRPGDRSGPRVRSQAGRPTPLERGKRQPVGRRSGPTEIVAHRDDIVRQAYLRHATDRGLIDSEHELRLMDFVEPGIEITGYGELDATMDTRMSGWETGGAEGQGLVFYTGNWFASLSSNGGSNWVSVNQRRQRGPVDQTVQYCPQIDMFIWVHLPSDGGELLVSVIDPEEMNASNAEDWTTWTFTPSLFPWVTDASWWFDFPSLSTGDSFAYVVCNVPGSARSAVFRISFDDLRHRGGLRVSSLLLTRWGFRAAQDITDVGYFAAHSSTEGIEMWRWPEAPGHTLHWAIDSIPTFDDSSYRTTLPDGTEWFADSDSDILGATRRNENEIWYAWTAGADRRFPYPHVRIAITDADLKVVGSRFIWNDRFAFAFPDLATSTRGEVGLVYAWGGGQEWVHTGVGLMTGTPNFVNVSFPGVAAGGDYLTIRRSHPDGSRFMGAVFWQERGPDGVRRNHPQYVQFRRA